MNTSVHLIKLLFISGILSLTLMLLNFYLFISDIINVVLSNTGIIVGIGYLIIFKFLALSIIYFGRIWKQNPLLITILTISGLIALFSFAVDKVMFDEIAKQYQTGMSINEVNILFISAAIKIILIAGYLFALYKYGRSVIRI